MENLSIKQWLITLLLGQSVVTSYSLTNLTFFKQLDFSFLICTFWCRPGVGICVESRDKIENNKKTEDQEKKKKILENFWALRSVSGSVFYSRVKFWSKFSSGSGLESGSPFFTLIKNKFVFTCREYCMQSHRFCRQTGRLHPYHRLFCRYFIRHIRGFPK